MKNQFIMKNNTFFKLFIIIILALVLRLWFIDKPEGLWNDEYVGWFIASQKDFHKFISEIFNNCHTPLYYLYLKLWLKLFPDTDLSLRLSSVIPSLIAIPVMYKIGYKLKDIKTGLLAAFITAISSFNIYFAQEVRLYSLLFLFSALVALYFIKVCKENSKLTLLLYFTFNALLCATHTLGLIFSFFNILALIYYEMKNKDNIKNILSGFKELIKYTLPVVIAILLLMPLLISIVFSKSLSQFWSDFSFSKIIFTFIDYFSPIQTNISTSPDSILPYIYAHSKINYSFIIFAIIPLITAFVAIIKAVREKDKILNLLLISSFLFFTVLIILSISGKMVLSTKYSIEMYPILILAISVGLLSFNKIILKLFLLIMFAGLNLIYIAESSTSAPKLPRPEGHRTVVELIKNSRLKQNDIVILTYYDIDRFQRYLPAELNYNFISINKFNFNYIMFNNENYYQTIKYGKTLYKDYFYKFPNQIIQKYSYDKFKTQTKKGDKIGIVYLDNVSFLSIENIKNILQNEEQYQKTPFIFLAFSTLKNNLMYSFKNDYKIDSITQSGAWTLIVYEKITD